MRIRNYLTLFLAFGAMTVVSDACGRWPSDISGVTLYTGYASDIAATADGARGAIVGWVALDISPAAIFAQLVDARGNTKWNANGAAIALGQDNFRNVFIVSDGMGGAIIAGRAMRPSGYVMLVQRVDSAGISQWGTGIDAIYPVNEGTGVFPHSAMFSDGAGGAIISMQFGNRIYFQRVDSNGTFLWGDNALVFLLGNNPDSTFEVGPDGSGGAVIIWQDINVLLFAQRLDSTGAPQWGDDGIALSSERATFPAFVPDGSGGFIFTWELGGDQHIYAQSVAPSGELRWDPNGVKVSYSVGNQEFPQPVSDGRGGAIMAFDSESASSAPTIEAQKVARDGSLPWGKRDKMLLSAPYGAFVDTAISDGAGGAIVEMVKVPGNFSSYDLYAQRLGSRGNSLWK